MELVSGRPPRDVVTIEHASPEQLTTPETTDTWLTELCKLAMKSYLEARQRTDLRKDIAARLLPSEGPFLSPGDKVYYWQIDKNKIKQGPMSSRWYKARVLSQE